MMIIGCDFHTRYQQIAMLDDATGELTERRLEHESGEVRKQKTDERDAALILVCAARPSCSPRRAARN